jgi:histone deacetylase complex subunit SAP18
LVQVREVNPESRQKGTMFEFSLVSPVTSTWGTKSGPRGEMYHYSMRNIGATVSGTKSVDDSKTLAQCR